VLIFQAFFQKTSGLQDKAEKRQLKKKKNKKKTEKKRSFLIFNRRFLLFF